jgi:hypothetical protein
MPSDRSTGFSVNIRRLIAGAARGAPAVENDSTDTEVIATEAGRGSGLWNAVAVSCLAATLLVAVGYVVAAIVEEVGGQVPPTSVKAYTLLLATDWAAPYFAVIPLVAIAIAWWQVRGLTRRSLSAAGDPAPSAGAPAYTAIIQLLRARAVALTGAAVLLIVAAAAVGCAIGNFIVYNTPSVPSAELWASEVERLSNALATLAICGAGIAAAFLVRRAVRSHLPATVALEDLAVPDDEGAIESEGEEPAGDPVAGEPASL